MPAVLDKPSELLSGADETPVETILREYIVLRDVSQEPKSATGKSTKMSWVFLNRRDRHELPISQQNDTVVVYLTWTVQAPPNEAQAKLWGQEWPEQMRVKPYWKPTVYRGRRGLRFTDDDWVAAAKEHGRQYPEGAKE